MSNNNENKNVDLEDGVKSTIADRVNRILRDWMIDIVLVLIIAVYLLKTLVTVEVTTNDVYGIIGDCALMLIFLISIKSLMMRKGMFAGEKNERYIKVKERYEKELLSVMHKSQYLSDYAAIFNEREEREKLTRILAGYGMNYEQYRAGIVTPTKLQRMGIKAAKKAKYTHISVADLTGGGAGDEKKPGLGMTKSQFLKTKSMTDIGITLVSALIFSVFTFRLAGEFDWANLIWVALQVVVFLIKGAMSFMSAYVFVTEEYTNRLIRQTNLLIDFDNTDINTFESEKESTRRKEEAIKKAEEDKRQKAEAEAERAELIEEIRILREETERLRITAEIIEGDKDKLNNENNENTKTNTEENTNV